MRILSMVAALAALYLSAGCERQVYPSSKIEPIGDPRLVDADYARELTVASQMPGGTDFQGVAARARDLYGLRLSAGDQAPVLKGIRFRIGTGPVTVGESEIIFLHAVDMILGQHGLTLAPGPEGLTVVRSPLPRAPEESPLPGFEAAE